MGARAQILIKDENVYLYTHYGANSIENDLKKILDLPKARNRWKDSEYLTRIIFSEMIKNDIDGETGFGIGSSKHGDIEVLISLNCEKETVVVTDIYTGKIEKYPSFQNFIG